MRSFIHEDFLLESGTAHRLFHRYTSQLPVIDYHSHMDVKQIAEDRHFESITQLCLDGNQSRARLMRANGVDERYITGDASDRDKFRRWADIVPLTLRNPQYHWTHMELQTAFGIGDVLNADSADRIFDRCAELLEQPEFSVRGLIRKYNVQVLCTINDPIDSLQHHQNIQRSGFECKVLPVWSPDRAVDLSDTEQFRRYVRQLAQVADANIDTLDQLLDALKKRHDYFAECGCTIAKHNVARFPWRPCGTSIARTIFTKAMAGHIISQEEQEQFQTVMLLALARMNAARGWAQQIFFGTLHNACNRNGLSDSASRFDAIGNNTSAEALVAFLDNLEQTGELAKTILFNINPAENAMVAAIVENFQNGAEPGKMQYGAGWWYNATPEGMLSHLNAQSEHGLLSKFIGMFTDGTSFLSFSRHEYFRRVLCNLLGSDVERGLIPMQEIDRVSQMVQDISYRNAKAYFGV